MCIQKTRSYTCGCVKSEVFEQCEQHANSNVRCAVITKQELEPSGHYCISHLLKAGTAEDPMGPSPMFRRGAQ